MRTAIIIITLLCSLLHDVICESVKCFCDRRNCGDARICNGEVCLIGIRNDGDQARLDQLCATEEIGMYETCQHVWRGWQEVCACDEDLCNTFAFFRRSSEQQSLVFDSQQKPTLNEENVHRYRSNSLVILLVIIPLSVGGLAVCLIFLNYHCKMC
ncbi:hypothetical protein AB6A40_003069 [Gnathostoma spinigerum]|uniref:Uncharacterized protein n=1 Tax=Gnathostoma spinigerum TaxID=75299 RepID=A0ABD6E9M7_9BILA